MATITPPESEEQTGLATAPDAPAVDDGLEESFAAPSYTGNDAGDNRPSPSGDKPSKPSSKSFMQKHGKKLAVGGGAAALAIPIVMFMLFLMLFKNVHIRSLYFDFRMAQFNRGLNARLKGALEEAKTAPQEAKPSGTSETTTPAETATPEEIMKSINAEEVGKLQTAPPEAITQASTELSNLAQAPEGAGAPVDADLGLERSIEDPATTDSVKAQAQAEAELRSGEAKLKGTLPDDIKNASEEAAKLQEAEKLSAPEAAKAALDRGAGGGGAGGGGFFSEAVREAQGPFVLLTFYCIFHQIYVDLAEQLNEILVHGAANVAMSLAKTADCQKEGKCSMEVASATANKYDNGKESFTQSCGYSYASGGTGGSCKPIDSAYLVGRLPLPEGYKGAAELIDSILNPPLPGSLVSEVCDVVLEPGVQIAAAAAGLAAIAASGGGAKAVGEALAKGLAAALATIGGKAMAVSMVAQYGGGLFKNLSPVLLGNLTDMGAKTVASDLCRQSGCPKLTAEQYHQSVMEWRQERLAEANRRGVWYKLFGTDNSDSALVRVALATPTTPQAIMARGGSLLGSIFNPNTFVKSLGSIFVATTSTATIADSTEDPNLYGIPSYGPVNTGRWKILENSKWVQQRGVSSLQGKYGHCFSDKFTKSAIVKLKGDGTPIDADGCNDGSDDWAHYSQYRFDQRALRLMSLRYNGQGSPSSTSATSRIAGSVGASTTSGAVNAQGYSYPIGPQCQNCLTGVQTGYTINSKPHGTIPAFDIHGKGSYDTGNEGGQPVYAIHSGTIFHINENDPGWCYGVTLHANDGANGYSDGYTYWYGHLNNLTVKERDTVTAGQIIGYTAKWTTTHRCPSTTTGESTSGRSHLHIQRGCLVNGKPADVGFRTCELDWEFVPFLSRLFGELPLDLQAAAATPGAQVGTGKTDPTGYIFPLAPQTRSGIQGITVGQTTSSHTGGISAYDLFGPGHAGNKGGDKVYAMSAGTVAFVQTKEAGWCYAIEVKASDSFYYVYDHIYRLPVKQGDSVAKGQLLGYTAPWTATHNCAGTSGSTHLHMNRGCVIDTKPQFGGKCMDPDFIPFLSKLYATLP